MKCETFKTADKFVVYIFVFSNWKYIKYHVNEKVVNTDSIDILKLIGIEIKKYRNEET